MWTIWYLTLCSWVISGALTMFLKWALRVPVVWWYSITQLLLRISPLLSLKEIKNPGVSCNVCLGPLEFRIQLFPERIKQNDPCLDGRGKNMRAFRNDVQSFAIKLTIFPALETTKQMSPDCGLGAIPSGLDEKQQRLAELLNCSNL